MTSKVTKTLIAAGISLPLLIVSAFGFTNALKQRSNVDYSSWMENIPDSTPLRDIAIPGTHDTMALYSIADVAGKCQSLPLAEQLRLGVRFLDIRLRLDNDEPVAVHGFINQRSSLKEITKVVNEFLIINPSETIIMSIKEEEEPVNSEVSFEFGIMAYLPGEFYRYETTLPSTLGEARGEAILLSRYKDSTIGVPAYDGWKDSCSFTLPNDIYVQDKYKITNKEEKQDEIVNCFNESGHALKINFLSAYKTNSFPPSYAPSAAKDINPWIDEEINKYNDRGIVLYDFVTESNMKAFFKGVL